MQEKIYFSVPEIARITGLSKYFLRTEINAGRIPYLKSGNKFLICLPRLQEILQQQELTKESCGKVNTNAEL